VKSVVKMLAVVKIVASVTYLSGEEAPAWLQGVGSKKMTLGFRK
jgi:hypothetical protein